MDTKPNNLFELLVTETPENKDVHDIGDIVSSIEETEMDDEAIVTGGLIRTGVTGSRIELDGRGATNTLTMYDALGDTVIRMVEDAQYYNGTGWVDSGYAGLEVKGILTAGDARFSSIETLGLDITESIKTASIDIAKDIVADATYYGLRAVITDSYAYEGTNNVYGLYGHVNNADTAGDAIGVYGRATNIGSGSAYAGYFEGDAVVTGNLDVTGNITGTYSHDHDSDYQPLNAVLSELSGLNLQNTGYVKFIGGVATISSVPIESHTHPWSEITATPTTLAGYGITDASPSNHDHEGVYSPIGHNHANVYQPVDVLLTRISDLSSIGSGLVRMTNGTVAYDATDYATSTELSTGLGTKADLIHDHTGTYDKYSNWVLYINGTLEDTISSGGVLDLRSASSELTIAFDDVQERVDFTLDLSGYATDAELTTGLAGKSDTGHDHSGTYIPTTHAVNAITSTNISNWDTAHGWGNHASAGYSVDGHGHAIADVTGLDLVLNNLSTSIAGKQDASSVLDEIIGASASNGFLTFAGGVAVIDTNSYALSGHNHAGVYQPTDVLLTQIAGLVSNGTGLLRFNAGTASFDTASYSTTSHDHAGVYLPIGGTASDSTLLDGHDSSYFATNTDLNTLAGSVYTETEVDTLLAGKSDTGHTHSYLSTGGGTLTGDLTIDSATNANLYVFTQGTNSGNSRLFLGEDTTTYGAYIIYDGVANVTTVGSQGAGDASAVTLFDWARGGNVADFKGTPTVNGTAVSLSDHLHDSRYYTETEIDTALAGKSDSGHTHDDRYYTETQIDTMMGGKLSIAHETSHPAPTNRDTRNQVASSVLDEIITASATNGFLKFASGVAVIDTNSYSLSSHTHSYLPLSGGVMTGFPDIHRSDSARVFQTGNSSASNADQFYIDHNYGNVTIGNLRGGINFAVTPTFEGNTPVTSANIASQTVSQASTASNADTLDGQHGNYYATNANLNTLAGSVYTETEVDTLLAGKSDTGHTHSYLPLGGGTLTGELVTQDLVIGYGKRIYMGESGNSKTLSMGAEGENWYLREVEDSDKIWLQFTDDVGLYILGNKTATESWVSSQSYLTGNQTITLSGDVSGSGTTSIAVTVADDSHNHIIGNVDGLQSALDGKSATNHNHSLDSLSNTTITSNSAGEILKWNGSAWINNTLAEAGIQPAGSYLTGNQTITLSGDATGSGTTAITVTVANDSHTHDTRYYTETEADGRFLALTATASNSTLLDNLDSTQFLRSDVDDSIGGTLTFAQDKRLVFSANSAWGATLSLGGNGQNAGTTQGSIAVTNGNLHIDSGTAYATYLNYYSGTVGVHFGSGASAIVATMDNAGQLWQGSSKNNKYWHAGNDGTGSGLDADLWDGNQFSSYLNQAVLTSSTPTFSGVYGTNFGINDGGFDCYMAVSDSNPTWQGEVYGGTFTFYGDKSRPSSLLYVGGLEASRKISAVEFIENGTKLDNKYTLASIGLTTLTTFGGDVSGTYNNIVVADDSHNHIIANVDGLQTSLDNKLNATANAVSASKWATARTITLAGDLSGSVSIDGSANVTLTGTVANDSHTHDGRYFTEAEADGRFLALTATASNSTLFDNLDSTAFVRQVSSSSATVGGGWMTVAYSSTARQEGEVYVTDPDSGDHAFIRIHWMRSYADSNFTVINTGGHSNRITGARVLYQTADNTYGPKYLQVYVTVSSTYSVRVVRSDIPNFGSISTVTPVIENTKTGYAVHGSTLDSLDAYGMASEEGFKAGGSIYTGGAFYEAGTALSSKYLGISANAVSSSKWATARTISLTGDVTGSTSMDGTGNVSITATVGDDSHNHIISNIDGLQSALDGKSATNHNHSLDSLSNTTITSVASGEIIKWNGSSWINNTLAEAGIQPASTAITTSNIGSQSVSYASTSGWADQVDVNTSTSTGWYGTLWNSGDTVYTTANVSIRPSDSSIKATKIFLGDAGNGYFFSDSDGRTAFTGGHFYIQSGVGTYYNYATTQYHGGSSGDTHYFRGNNLSGDGWSLSGAGAGAFASLSVTGNITVSGTVDGVDIASFKSAYDSHNHNGAYLGLTSTASNSALLDNLDSSQFLRSDTADTMSGQLTLTNDSGSNLILTGGSPQIWFKDDGTDDNFWIHVNSNNFYVLADRDGTENDDGWDSPHPLQLEGDTNIGYVFGQRIFNEAYHPNADTLTTARTINGTSFNGSANITTANWGTARTLTIGSTGKSVNGSGNVSWSVSEIGAQPASAVLDEVVTASAGTGLLKFTAGVASLDTNSYSTTSHTHDSRYYTESEINTLLAGKADTHSHPYLSSSGGTISGDLTVGGGNITLSGSSDRHKLRVYSSGPYAIGMQSGITYGGLNDWAMTFQFNSESDRGFWWGDDGHSTAQGAMSLTTDGYLNVANGLRIGYGESDTTKASSGLQVSGNISVTGTVDGRDVSADGSKLDGIATGANYLPVSDTPNSGYSSTAISSHWAYTHITASDPHTQYQLESTAINTGNIGSQSVNYASSAGNADTVDGQHGSYYATNANLNTHAGDSTNPHDVTASQVGAIAQGDVYYFEDTTGYTTTTTSYASTGTLISNMPAGTYLVMLSFMGRQTSSTPVTVKIRSSVADWAGLGAVCHSSVDTWHTVTNVYVNPSTYNLYAQYKLNISGGTGYVTRIRGQFIKIG